MNISLLFYQKFATHGDSRSTACHYIQIEEIERVNISENWFSE